MPGGGETQKKHYLKKYFPRATNKLHYLVGATVQMNDHIYCINKTRDKILFVFCFFFFKQFHDTVAIDRSHVFCHFWKDSLFTRKKPNLSKIKSKKNDTSFWKKKKNLSWHISTICINFYLNSHSTPWRVQTCWIGSSLASRFYVTIIFSSHPDNLDVLKKKTNPKIPICCFVWKLDLKPSVTDVVDPPSLFDVSSTGKCHYSTHARDRTWKATRVGWSSSSWKRGCCLIIWQKAQWCTSRCAPKQGSSALIEYYWHTHAHDAECNRLHGD